MIQLLWSSAQQAREVIPSSALSTESPPQDGGTPTTDGGSGDAGTPDAGMPAADGGSGDAGRPDAGNDAGAPAADAGSGDAGTPSDAGTNPKGLWVSAYYAGWFPEQLPASRIDFSAMTHLVVGRASVGAGGTVSQALDASPANGVARATDLADRAHAAGKKAILMLGGAGDGANFASGASAANRSNFVQNILTFLSTTHMDGVDLDWEESINRNDWLALCSQLRAARPNLIITLPVFVVNINQGLSAADKSFFAAVHQYVDQINAMSYGIGMAGPWSGWVTWHTGALTGEASNHPSSISSTLAAYAAAGVPKAKLGMGIGFYGLNFGPPNTAPLQTPQGAYGADDVEWRYSRIVSYLNGHAGNRVWDANAQIAYLSFPGGFSPGAGFAAAGFLSYEDPQSIAAKGAWTKANGYGGTILWTINYGCTDPTTGANPLLTATKQAFLTS
jgi:chitinase